MNRVPNVSREALLASLFAVLALAALAFVLFGGDDDPDFGPPPLPAVTGDVLVRDKVISDGGYNTFAGAWLDPRNGAVGTAFANVKGPAAAPCSRPEVPKGCADRGFRGARHTFVVTESKDNGRTWTRPLPDEALPSAAPHAFSGQPTTMLRAREGQAAGTLLRRVNGEDLHVFPETAVGVPPTAYLERRAPGAAAWSGREVLLDPARFTYNLTRIMRLRDGKTLVATGGFWEIPAGERLKDPAKSASVNGEWLLMTSTDEGATWKDALGVPPPQRDAAPANEWDVAELRNGDLLAVMRTREGTRTVRKQAILEKTDDEIKTNTGTKRDGGWIMRTPRLTPASFEQVPGPQHPELLSIEYGPARGGVLHIADEAIHYSPDDGDTWQKVAFPSDWTPHYYPNSVQARGANIYVFSHAGSDENYTTAANKPVYADIVRLAPDREATP